jgi:hypothetical protein
MLTQTGMYVCMCIYVYVCMLTVTPRAGRQRATIEAVLVYFVFQLNTQHTPTLSGYLCCVCVECLIGKHVRVNVRWFCTICTRGGGVRLFFVHGIVLNRLVNPSLWPGGIFSLNFGLNFLATFRIFCTNPKPGRKRRSRFLLD